jgi:hypothetical protein
MAHVRVRQKVRSHLVSRGAWDQLEVAQQFFLEHGTVPATTIVDGRVRITDDLPGLLSIELPSETLELSRTESRLQACALHAEWVGSSLRLTGWAIVRGVDLDRRSFQREMWFEHAGSGARKGLELEALSLPEATEWAKWAHGSVDSCGFRAVIEPGLLADGTLARDWRVRLRVTVDGVIREGALHHAVAGSSASQSALTSQRLGDERMLVVPRLDPEHGLTVSIREAPPVVARLRNWRRMPRRLARALVPRPLIEATAVAVESDTITVRVAAAARWEGLLRSARLTDGDEEAAAVSHERIDARAWRLDLRTTVASGASPRSLRPGSYRLVTGDRGATPRSITVAAPLIGALPIAFHTVRHRGRVILSGRRDLRIELGAPLGDDERSAFAQAQLRAGYARIADPREEAVLFHDPEARAQGVLAAAHARLREGGSVPSLRWGVPDTSLEVPAGGTAVVIGSREWYRWVGTASTVIAASDIGPFVRPRSGQKFILVAPPELLDAIGRTAWWRDGLTPGHIEHEIARYGATWEVIVVIEADDVARVRRELDFPGEVMVGENDVLVEAVLRPR